MRARGALAAALLLLAATAAGQVDRDSQAPVEARVQDLLRRMTPEEKFWQLFMLAGESEGDPARFVHAPFGLQVAADPADADPLAHLNALQRHFVEGTRLGIPAVFFGEALHGLVQRDATVFPQAIGLAASFDAALMDTVAAAIAAECRARGVRQVLSPVVNLARDPRWGRTEETYGEDPFLASAMGAAFVAAFEQRGVIATPKHWLANVGEGGRDSYPIDIGERTLRETYLPPFAACLAAGARSAMTAYNSLDGRPCSANAWLNSALLKQELGFTGFLISDAGAVGGANVLHLTAGDYADAAAQSLNAGLDVIFQTSIAHAALFSPPFLDGRIPAARIDEAVARVLRAKFALGLFEAPYAAAASFASPGAPAHRALARRAARASCVLLKNAGDVLPLRAGLRSIAVLGPDAAEARLGGYSAPSTRAVSVLEGLRERAGDGVTVRHAAGCARLAPTWTAVPAAALPGGLGVEFFPSVEPAGEPVARRRAETIEALWTLGPPDPALARDFYSVRWQGSLAAPAAGRFRLGVEGDDGWRLFLADTLFIDNWQPIGRGLRSAAVALAAGARVPLRLEFKSPTGDARLRLVWDRGAPDEEAALAEAVAAAAASELAILVLGIEEGEFRDRASLALPGQQEELIARVAALGKPVVVVLVGGSAVTLPWLDAVDALLLAWYPGEEGGRAVADLLFGDANPAGRLPLAFPLAEGQLPWVYDHRPTGRGDDYLDLPGLPRFPFGFGLSYTEFAYSDLRIEPTRIGPGQSATVHLAIENTGGRAGEEVVQLYLHDELASVARPLQRLAGFQRVLLAPGERRELAFAIAPAQLSLLDATLAPRVEPGGFRVMVGASSRDIRLRGLLTVSE